MEPSVSLGKRKEETEDIASYAHLLNDNEKAWLNQFAKEYINADTNPEHAIFHRTPEEKKICNDKNNARNRCWYTEEAAANRLNLVENDFEMEKILYNENETGESNYSEREDD